MSSDSGRAPRRDVDGILIFDKPVGLSSNRALQQVKHLYRARKAGHCGSLDPMASGILPICFGQATRFSSYLIDADKSYRANCRLGQTTTTGDAEGELLETREIDVDLEKVTDVLQEFRGHIEQVPPMYSALHHEGRRLYELAREGKRVERAARPLFIETLELVSLTGDELVFDVRCSKGTYVRSLAEDIGAALGCGAHLGALRRTSVGDITLAQAHPIEQIEQLADAALDQIDALLLPASAALSKFPELDLSTTESVDMRQGKRLRVDIGTAPGLYRLNAPEEGFIGLGEVGTDAELKAKRLMNTNS